MTGKPPSDARFMQRALELAREAGEAGDVPVGAVVTVGDEIVGEGRNLRVADADPLAHAEVIALRQAARATGSWRLDEATLYVTLEPCPMCAGALVHARLGRLVYGVDDPRGGAVRSLYQICEDPRLHHRLRVRTGVLEEACRDVLQSFFRSKRGA